MMQAESIWTETDQHLFEKNVLLESICFFQHFAQLSAVNSFPASQPAWLPGQLGRNFELSEVYGGQLIQLG